MISPATLEAFTTEWFFRGLLFGGAGLVIGWVVSAVWSRRRRRPAPLAGALMAAAALLAMPVARAVPGELWQAAGLLAAGGLFFPWSRRVPLLPSLLALPGAWWLTQRTGIPGASWVPWVLFGAIVAGAPLVASFDQRHAGRGFAPPLIAVTVAGAFTTLPDTEEVLVLLGAALPLALLAWPKPMASLGGVGAYPVVGMLAWVAAWGGRGREGAVIGAIGCLGLLVAEPLARMLVGRTLLERILGRWWGAPIAIVSQTAVVLGSARLAGLRSSAIAAALTTAGVLATTIAALLLRGASQVSGRHSTG